MKFKFEDGRVKAEKVKESAEDSLLASELNLAVLKEVINITIMSFLFFCLPLLMLIDDEIILGAEHVIQ